MGLADGIAWEKDYGIKTTSKESNHNNRIVQVAIKHIVEIPANVSDIDDYLHKMFPDKEFQWCDNDQDIFGDF